MNITTREARLEDLTILLEFEQGIIDFERPFDLTLKDEKISYYDIKAMILSEDVFVAVAVNGDEVVGSGYARIEVADPYLKHKKFAYLGFMYVKENARGKGVNGLVVEALNTWIRSQGVDEVRLDVYYENPGAIRAYEKVGFKKLLINMRMSLKDS
ncbi:MAG: GNAT superfamily N-acetyltransferase [Candidatus Azotimanducaceae bacterium]|jgi:GNAT superfamily N-acetyltransferase